MGISAAAGGGKSTLMGMLTFSVARLSRSSSDASVRSAMSGFTLTEIARVAALLLQDIQSTVEPFLNCSAPSAACGGQEQLVGPDPARAGLEAREALFDIVPDGLCRSGLYWLFARARLIHKSQSS